MNFAADFVDAAPPDHLALLELGRDGSRREWRFGEVADRSARLAGTLKATGIDRGDVVMTLIGNRPEWAFAMIACFRIGAVVLPCNEQLRAKDLRYRIEAANARAIVAHEHNAGELTAAAPPCPTLMVPDESLFAAEPAPAAALEPSDPCLIVFTSGTAGEPTGIVHGQHYLPGQHLQAEHWFGARAGELAWCTAASGWSKSARNAFIAPWLQGAAALLHDDRFDVRERLEILARERVNVLCMAPTEYRAIAKRATIPPLPALRTMVAAGEALNPEVIRAFHEVTGLDIRDGYGQTETGALTAQFVDQPVRPGSMGHPLPGIALTIEEGQLVLSDPTTDPTFFVSYLDGRPAPSGAPWPTGDRVERDEDGYLYFVSRADDMIISAGYRIGPVEVESALVSHEAVVEAGVVSAPDEIRGQVVRAVVVLRDGFQPSETLIADLQEHVRHETAPYKYPRIVDFADELPKTASGKIRRAVLRNS
jgi:acyl-coenzyme A synthetase/AMP-(fatty) acid ligase